MSGIDPVGNGVTSQLVSMALDGALARHAAIATNIANVGTPGYQPVMARFDELVEQLRGRVEDRSLDSSTERVVQTLKDSLESEPQRGARHADGVSGEEHSAVSGAADGAGQADCDAGFRAQRREVLKERRLKAGDREWIFPQFSTSAPQA
jgi:hypothetical protein